MSQPKPKPPRRSPGSLEPDMLVEVKVVLAIRKVELPEMRDHLIKQGACHLIDQWAAQIIEETIAPSRGVHAVEFAAGKQGVRGQATPSSD